MITTNERVNSYLIAILVIKYKPQKYIFLTTLNIYFVNDNSIVTIEILMYAINITIVIAPLANICIFSTQRVLFYFYISSFMSLHTLRFKTKKAFTLVEMLIVIVIIGILAAALIPKLQGMQGRARDVARKADLNQLGTAFQVYQVDLGTYPTNTG